MKKSLSLMLLSLLSATSFALAMDEGSSELKPSSHLSVKAKDNISPAEENNPAFSKILERFKNVWESHRQECLASLRGFSAEQIDVLGRHEESLLPKMVFGDSYKGYLEALREFPPEKLEVLGRCTAAIFPRLQYDKDRTKCLGFLSALSLEQLKILGPHAPMIFKKADGYYLKHYITPLVKFSPERLEALGRNASSIFENLYGEGFRYGMELSRSLNSLSEFSPEQLDVLGKYGKGLIVDHGSLASLSKLPPEKLEVLGRTAPVIFADVGGHKHGECLGFLMGFSIEQIEVLRNFAPETVKNMAYRSDWFFPDLKMFSPQQLAVLGKYEESLIPKMQNYHDYLKVLSEFSPARMELVGQQICMPWHICDESYVKDLKSLKSRPVLWLDGELEFD